MCAQHDLHLTRIIFENPGIHYSGIREIVNLSNGSLQRILKRLEISRSIKVSREVGRTRYFDRMFSENHMAVVSLLRRPTIKNIIETLFKNKRSSFQEILQKSKKSPSPISFYLSELCGKNIVERKLEKIILFHIVLKTNNKSKKLLIILKKIVNCKYHNLSIII